MDGTDFLVHGSGDMIRKRKGISFGLRENPSHILIGAPGNQITAMEMKIMFISMLQLGLILVIKVRHGMTLEQEMGLKAT
jgi:hypothetical protein